MGGPGPREVGGHNAGYEKGESGDSEAAEEVGGVGGRVWASPGGGWPGRCG